MLAMGHFFNLFFHFYVFNLKLGFFILYFPVAFFAGKNRIKKKKPKCNAHVSFDAEYVSLISFSLSSVLLKKFHESLKKRYPVHCLCKSWRSAIFSVSFICLRAGKSMIFGIYTVGKAFVRYFVG